MRNQTIALGCSPRHGRSRRLRSLTEDHCVDVIVAENPISNGNQMLWHIASATTPGYNTVVGERSGTAFSVSAQAPLDTLTEVVAKLVAIPRGDWLQQATDGESVPTNTTETMTQAGPPTDYELADLAVTTQ